MKKFDRRLIGVWVLLILATLFSCGSALEGSGIVHFVPILVIGIAFLKVRYVGLEFMELRHAPPILRWGFEAWTLALALTLILLHANTSSVGLAAANSAAGSFGSAGR